MDTELMELVQRARSGEQDAWDELVSRFAGMVAAIARQFRLSPDDAADVSQTTWLRLLESIDRVREPERIGAWLGTTARRECLRLLRLAGREAPTDAVDRGEASTTFPAPGQELISAQERETLWTVVQELPDRHRRLMLLLMASPRPSYADVADTLDMPIGSIGPTRMRVIDRLRRDPDIGALAG